MFRSFLLVTLNLDFNFQNFRCISENTQIDSRINAMQIFDHNLISKIKIVHINSLSFSYDTVRQHNKNYQGIDRI